MKTYRIESSAGVDLGTYDGENEFEAWEEMHRIANSVPTEWLIDDMIITEID